jgi:glycosyltransferase involved in cell wall biosynthesis
VTEQVRFVPARSPKDIVELLTAADVLLYVPRDEAHSYTVLEAMGCGLPVIASRVGWLTEIFPGGYPWFVDPRDPKGIADAISRFFTQKGFKAERLPQEYRVETTIKGYETLLRDAEHGA